MNNWTKYIISQTVLCIVYGGVVALIGLSPLAGFAGGIIFGAISMASLMAYFDLP